MKTHSSLTLIAMIVGIFIAVIQPTTASAQSSSADMRRQAKMLRENADRMARSDSPTTRGMADGIRRNAEKLEAMADEADRPRKPRDDKDHLTAPPVSQVRPKFNIPPLKLRPLSADQRAKTAQVLEKLGFKPGDSIAYHTGLFSHVANYIGLVSQSAVTDPGLDSAGLIVFDLSIRLRMPELHFMQRPEDYYRASPNLADPDTLLEPAYTGPEVTALWRIFIRFDELKVIPERIEALGNDNPDWPQAPRVQMSEEIEQKLKYTRLNV